MTGAENEGGEKFPRIVADALRHRAREMRLRAACLHRLAEEIESGRLHAEAVSAVWHMFSGRDDDGD